MTSKESEILGYSSERGDFSNPLTLAMARYAAGLQMIRDPLSGEVFVEEMGLFTEEEAETIYEFRFVVPRPFVEGFVGRSPENCVDPFRWLSLINQDPKIPKFVFAGVFDFPTIAHSWLCYQARYMAEGSHPKGMVMGLVEGDEYVRQRKRAIFPENVRAGWFRPSEVWPAADYVTIWGGDLAKKYTSWELGLSLIEIAGAGSVTFLLPSADESMPQGERELLDLRRQQITERGIKIEEVQYFRGLSSTLFVERFGLKPLKELELLDEEEV